MIRLVSDGGDVTSTTATPVGNGRNPAAQMSGTTPSGRSPASVRVVKPGSLGSFPSLAPNFRIAIREG